MSLISGVPVSAISSGRAVRDRMRSESSQDVLRALRGLVLDEVRLVDDHAAEAEVAEPAHVAVEHLVVDDDDVGEAVDRVAVAVDHGGRAVRRPAAGLAGPVGLDDVRHDHEQRIGVRPPRRRAAPGPSCPGPARRRAGRSGGRQRPRRPACAWCGISSRPAGREPGGRRGQRHAGRGPAAGALEGAEQRAEQLPAGQAARTGRAGRRGGEVGGEEGVGQLPGDHRLRHDPALGGGGRRPALGGRRPPRAAGSTPAARSMSRLSDRAASETTASSASSASSPASRTAVLARIVAMPSRRLSCSARCAVAAGRLGPDPGALLAQQQRDGLELRAHRRRHAAALGGRLDLADGAGEHRDDVAVGRTRRWLRGALRRAPVWRWPGRATDSSSALPGTERRAMLRANPGGPTARASAGISEGPRADGRGLVATARTRYPSGDQLSWSVPQVSTRRRFHDSRELRGQ